MRNGTFIITCAITQTGTMKFIKGVPNGIVLTINGVDFGTDQLESTDFPKYIELTPGLCSSLK